MATVRQLYDTEFKGDFVGPEGPMPFNDASGQAIDKVVIWKYLLSYTNRSLILVFYIPEKSDYVSLCKAVIDNHEWVLKVSKDLKILSGFSDEPFENLEDCVFTGRVIVYAEESLPQQFEIQLTEYATNSGVALVIRDKKYLERVMKRNKPLAFISHDFRDKDEIAKKLAISLTQNLCPVWYDEFSLNVGDSLREKIETGLKDCKKCILILTPNFLSNEGWTKREFDSIFTRELIENQRLVLPIWCGVSKNDIFQYSPYLADVYGLKWNSGLESITKELMKVLF